MTGGKRQHFWAGTLQKSMYLIHGFSPPAGCSHRTEALGDGRVQGRRNPESLSHSLAMGKSLSRWPGPSCVKTLKFGESFVTAASVMSLQLTQGLLTWDLPFFIILHPPPSHPSLLHLIGIIFFSGYELWILNLRGLYNYMQNVVYRCIFLGRGSTAFVDFSYGPGSPSNYYKELL